MRIISIAALGTACVLAVAQFAVLRTNLLTRKLHTSRTLPESSI